MVHRDVFEKETPRPLW